MVNNLACEDCRFLVKCSAYAKLKPCNDYKSIDDDDNDNNDENEN